MTTNDGTPTLATIVPWPRPISAGEGDREDDGDNARIVVRAPGQLELGHRKRGDAAEVADREVDLPEEKDEDDAVGEHGHARHLNDDVDEVGSREEVGRGESEEGDDRHLADEHRQHAEIARLDVVARPLQPTGMLLRVRSRGDAGARDRDVWLCAHVSTSGSGARDSRDLRRDPRGDRVDDFLLGRLLALVDADVAPESEHGDPVCDLEDVVQVVRDEHDRKASVGEALDEVEHLARLRHAERRGRLVEDDEARVPLHRLRHRHRLALAARERCDRLPDGANRGHGERRQRFARALLHRGLLQAEEPVTQLASEVHVLDDVQVVTQGEVLVHDLDPELGRVLRAVDGDRLSVEEDLAVVVAVDARDALDQRRLAGAVVADEGHDLAAPHLEVDRGERMHGAEALVEIANLEQRRSRGAVVVVVVMAFGVCEAWEPPALQAAPRSTCL